MKNMKTKYIWAITLVIAGLMISSAASIPAAEDNAGTSSVSVEKLNLERQTLEVETSQEVPMKQMPMSIGTPAFAFEDNQEHPGFGRTRSGEHIAAYFDEAQARVIWTFSPDDGASYDPGVYYDLAADYPSIELWDGSRFFGTLVSDYEWLEGGATSLFECTDPLDTATYTLIYWDWSDDGWSNMVDSDIAVDDSQLAWEWGMMSLVSDTTYTSPAYYAGPFVSYQTSEDGYATISWYTDLPDCEHTDSAIDHVTYDTYALYDRLNTDAVPYYELIVRIDHFDNWDAAGTVYQVAGDGDLKYPTVAANDDNVIVLAEQVVGDGSKDVICLYSDNGFTTVQESFVADTGDNETFPEIRHVQDEKFVCTFVMNDKLYKSKTEDAGATWSTPEEVDDCVEEYRTAALCDFGMMALYDYDNGADIDVYLANDIDEGPVAPILEVTINSGFGLGASAVIKNVGNAEATNVDYSISIVGGFLGLIDKTVNDTIATIAIGGEETISTGMAIGFGTVEISASASCPGTSDSATADGTQIIIFTMVPE